MTKIFIFSLITLTASCASSKKIIINLDNNVLTECDKVTGKGPRGSWAPDVLLIENCTQRVVK